MKYRAILTDPGNLDPERPVTIQSNSMRDILEWAYGRTDGGMDRPRGVLPAAVSDSAAVTVFEMVEKQIAVLTKNMRSETPK